MNITTCVRDELYSSCWFLPRDIHRHRQLGTLIQCFSGQAKFYGNVFASLLRHLRPSGYEFTSFKAWNKKFNPVSLCYLFIISCYNYAKYVGQKSFEYFLITKSLFFSLPVKKCIQSNVIWGD